MCVFPNESLGMWGEARGHENVLCVFMQAHKVDLQWKQVNHAYKGKQEKARGMISNGNQMQQMI